MVAGMSSRRSKIRTPATRFLAAEIPRLRSASSLNRLSIALASGMSVVHPRKAPRTSYMYVSDELASTPLIAMPLPTVPHSSVLACMTLSCAFHAIPTVVTPGPVALRSPWSPCHCWRSGFIAFVWSMPWVMRSTTSSVPSVPATPTGAAACVSAVAAGSSDTLPWAPQGNISQWGCPHLLQFAGGGAFRSKVHPLLLVRIVRSPTYEIWACTWGWCRVPVTAACGHCLAQCPSCPHE